MTTTTAAAGETTQQSPMLPPAMEAETLRTGETLARAVMELAMRTANAESFARSLYAENQTLRAELARLGG